MPSRWRRACWATCSGTSRASCSAAPAWRSSAGALGTWLVGEAGALLVMPGGRRVHCFCVRVADRDLPPSDRVAHLLLALREDEVGFATVANHAFAGAPWRVAAPAARRRCARRSTPRAARHALASPPVAYEVVIAGGGFGGLYAARRLERRLPRHSARIVLVSAENFLLYTPLLPGAASGSLEPRHVVVPAARGARVDRHPARPGHRRGPGRQRDLAAHGRRARRDAALRPADRGARLGAAGAAACRGSRSTAWASRAWPTRSRCATGRSGTSRWPRRIRTPRRGAPTSPSSSSARATPGWRAWPSSRTTWPT